MQVWGSGEVRICRGCDHRRPGGCKNGLIPRYQYMQGRHFLNCLLTVTDVFHPLMIF